MSGGLGTPVLGAADFVNVLAQIGSLSAYPIRSAIMIMLDALVLVALTAHWAQARGAM